LGGIGPLAMANYFLISIVVHEMWFPPPPPFDSRKSARSRQATNALIRQVVESNGAPSYVEGLSIPPRLAPSIRACSRSRIDSEPRPAAHLLFISLLS
jgi:hypothetical protein